MNLPLRKRIKIRTLFTGIGRKFILYFIFFSIIPIIFISLLGYHISENMVVKQNIRYLALQNELMENRLNEFFRKARFNISSQNSSNRSIYNWIKRRLRTPLPPECQDAQTIKMFLQENVKKYSEFRWLGLVNESAGIFCSSDSLYKPVSSRLTAAIASKNNLVIINNHNPFLPNPAIFILMPINRNNNRPKTYMMGLIENEQLLKIIRNIRSKKQISQTYIIDAQSQILFSTADTELHSNSGALERVNFAGEQNFIGRQNGVKVLRKKDIFPLFNWQIVSEIMYETAMSDLIGLRNQAILGVGLLLILLIGLAFYVSQRISVPIRQLVYSAQDIGDGLLEAPIKIDTGDEIGLLARELDEMRKNLLDYYENLERKVEKRTEELKRAQYQIMHQEKMASLGLLAAGIAHEIGNPLTSISSLTQLLKRRLKKDTNVRYLTAIMKNIDRISVIVRELVDFSRPSKYESKLTNVNEVVQAAVGIVKYDKRSKNLDIRLDLDINLPGTVLVADQLLQVFINILFNAVDAMEESGNELEVGTWQEEEHILIRFRDTGSGIPEDKINKIFEPFYTTKEVGKGTGLGLSVSYGIIRNFDGDISVQSEVGKGSIFTVRLPINKS